MPKADVTRLHVRPSLLPLLSGLILALLLGRPAAGAPPAPAAAPTHGSVEVAVFPFRVNSARPLDHLERSLPDVLRAKLEATGRVTVLDPAQVRERAGARIAADPGDASVRTVAGELGRESLRVDRAARRTVVAAPGGMAP